MSDERQQQTGESSEPQAPERSPGGAQEAAPSQEEEKTGGRFDAAKAFFRALHAGADDLPDLGINGAPAAEPGASQGPCRNCKYMESEIAEAKQKLAESDNLYKRMMADFENFRRRVDREREEFQAAGIQRTLENLLPALDDMDRANASLNADMPSDKVLESVKLVFNRLSRCLEIVGVKPLNVIGEHFDPKYHEPVQEIETTEVPNGAVVHELRRGYTLNDRVIRPALVNVACSPGGDQAAPAESEPEEAEAAEPAGEHAVYDLSSVEDSKEAEEALQKKLDEYLETPATGNRTADE